LIPLPVGIDKGKFVYLEANNELLYVDQTRQYYESCAIKLLQPRLNIQKICDIRILQIIRTVWTQFEKRNEWSYFIPSSDSITILCPEKEPVDIVLRGTGKLSIQSVCKGYSQTAFLTTQNNVQVNTSRHGGVCYPKWNLSLNVVNSLVHPLT
jgi:hypothetical protein